MAFRPSMTAFTEGIRLLGPLRWRGWSGGVADLWDATGAEGGGGHYLSPDPRLVVFLENGPAPVQLAAHPQGPAAGPTLGKVAFVPAGLRIWSRVLEARPFRHLDLHLDAAMLARRIEAGAGPGTARALDRPVLLDGHLQVEGLALMLAAEVAQPSHDDLVIDALTMAMLGMVLDLPRRAQAPTRGGLGPAQLRRVTNLMAAGLHRRIGVAELAEAAGLSESWFAHAFRQSVGTSPARHLTRLRVEAAQRLIREGGQSLGEVATATGFADQAHLTRAFRAATGTTPAAWRRQA